MVSNTAVKDVAKLLGIDPALVRAVAKVESGGAGFLPTGEPVILFEPHVFWKELKKRGLDPRAILAQYPQFSDILYPTWGTKPYGTSSKQHDRLKRACEINRDAALCSASWGMFQILGQNWKMCRCTSIQDFINKVYQNEDAHLHLFARFILSAGLEDELQEKDYDGFARGYNGPLYWRHKYGDKIKAAHLYYLANVVKRTNS